MARKSNAFNVIVLVSSFLQAASLRTRVVAREKSQSELDSPAGGKVIVVFNGFMQLNNQKQFKEIGSNGTSMYSVAAEDGVQLFVPLSDGNGKILETHMIHNVKSESLTLRGAAAFDISKVVLEHVLVSVKLTGTIQQVITDNIALFIRDDIADDTEQSLLVPFDKIHALIPGTIDYSVTKVSRAGKNVFQGNAALFYPLSLENRRYVAIHKEYVVTELLKRGSEVAEVQFPMYVKPQGYCGTELFTTTTLTCSLKESLNREVSTAERFAPTNNRGFGLEFEFVSRDVPDEIAEAAIDSFDTDPIPDNVEEFKHEHAVSYDDVDTYKEIVRGVQYVNYCFRQLIKSSASLQKCRSHTECKLNEFCRKSGQCGLRSVCQAGRSIDGKCPIRLSMWNWETDVSVKLLEEEEIQDIPDAGEDETKGVGMELVSPGPPNVLSGEVGIKSAAEVLGILAKQGAQAGPSQGLHVHVNAISSDAPGEKLTVKGIASVWAAWAKYQLAIDEMLSPGRPDNDWSGRLFLAAGEPWKNHIPDDCRKGIVTCVALFFMNMHKYIKSKPSEVFTKPSDSGDFCNSMMRLPGGDEKPCDDRYAHQRYSQVNLLPLTRYGTIEFRPHSATLSVERVSRWVQFLTAFVEHYGQSVEGLSETKAFFDESSAKDFAQLRDAQRGANLEDLFKALGNKVAKDSFEFFAKRKWEDEDKICNAAKQSLEGQSLLEIKRGIDAQKAERSKRHEQMPVEIVVPVPRNGY